MSLHAYDRRGCADYPLFVFLTRAAVPDSDGKCQDGLTRSAVEVSQDGMTGFQFLHLSEEEKPLVGFFDGGADILVPF